jgi:hypothetical protein
VTCQLDRERSFAMDAPGEHVGWDPVRTTVPDTTSDVPGAGPSLSIEEAVPHSAADAGGMDDIPLDLLPEVERVEVEFDLAGMDETWPEEAVWPDEPKGQPG